MPPPQRNHRAWRSPSDDDPRQVPVGEPASVCTPDLSLLRDDRASLTVVGADGCAAVRMLTAASLAASGMGLCSSIAGRRLVAVVGSTTFVLASAAVGRVRR